MAPRRERKPSLRIALTFDEQATRTLYEFMDREGYASEGTALKHLLQYALEEHPKNFPPGLWLSVMNDARSFAYYEASKFFFDLHRQLGNAASSANDPVEQQAIRTAFQEGERI